MKRVKVKNEVVAPIVDTPVVPITTADPAELVIGPTSVLSGQEECVLRMRHGITLSPDCSLAYEGYNHPETRARLALIEKRAYDLAVMNRINSKRKAHIIKMLKD